MATVDLELLKKHVNADDFTADDTYLQHLLDAAEAHVIAATNRTVAELMVPGPIGTAVLPAQLQQAVLMLAGHWYNQREAVSGVQMAEVPYALQASVYGTSAIYTYTLQALIKPYRKLVNDPTE